MSIFKASEASVKKAFSFNLLDNYPVSHSDLLLAFNRGGRKFIQYIVDLYLIKIFYLVMNIVTCDRTLILKIAIEKCRADNPRTRVIRVAAKELTFGHPVGWSFDFVLKRRTKELSQIQFLTKSKFNDICQSDSPPECFRGVLLNGNGRVKALIDSGHGDFVLDVIERFQ